jgi:CRISPR/Cas system CSM-associated protein Csm3 (group 7 of RAMP superfamily)
MANQDRWSGTQSRQIVKRIVVEGDLVLQTPAHFGGGASDGSELLILEDALEKRPLLPGASIAGALRHYLLTRQYGYRVVEMSDSLATILFGKAYDNDRGTQSRVIVDDALGEMQESLLSSRDGVKIAGRTRTADEGALYTFQVWSAGTTFKLRFELCLYADDMQMEDAWIRSFATAVNGLSNGSIPLGARKHRGFGRATGEKWRAHVYDFRTLNGLVDWVANGGNLLTDAIHTTPLDALQLTEEIGDSRQFVHIWATFRLDDSLLIRAGSDVADMAHLHNKQVDSIQQPILSGTSLTGALRARALKIAQTMNIRQAADLINDMFGAHDGTNDEDEPLSASRLIVEEHPIENGAFEYVQNRVKIDRFTGGAFDTGLFGQQPVFAADGTFVTVRLELRYPADLIEQQEHHIEAQTGLLFLLLKDLWTGDLPLGGESRVGRGRLRGQVAEITINNEHTADTIKLEQAVDGLRVDAPETLEKYVQAFLVEREGT